MSLISTKLEGESPRETSSLSGESPSLSGETPAAAGELETPSWSPEKRLEYRVRVELCN